MIDSYKAVFFDAGGTLLHPFPSVGEIYKRVAAFHGCQIEAEQAEKASVMHGLNATDFPIWLTTRRVKK